MRVKDNTKIDAIFRSVIELTGTYGIAGLKMSNVAKNANLASGTLYLYFENKERLLNALYLFLKKEAAQKTAVDLANTTVREKLYLLWKKTIAYRMAHQSELVFMEQFLVSPYVSRKSREATEAYYLLISGILDEGRVKKQLKDLDNSILLPLLSGYIRDLSTSLASPKTKPIETLVTQSFEVCWDALKA